MTDRIEKVLVVDDHPESLEYLGKILTEWGYEVIKAKRGLQAIKLTSEKKPDLVLLDVMMPDITGYEVCRALKIEPKTADTPIIFLTAKGEIFDRVEGLDMGAHDYVAKPFHPEELKARIRNAIRQKEEKEKLKQETAALKSLSLIDELTGFYNRRYLEERLQEELSRAKRYNYQLALALVSPDGFDEIRQLYSRSRGDAIIKQIGEIMKRNIRAIDIVARFSDTAFAVILPQTGVEGALVFGEKIRRIIERHLFYGIPDKTRITGSIGTAAYESEAVKDLVILIGETEKALKKAGDEGGNRLEVITL